MALGPAGGLSQATLAAYTVSRAVLSRFAGSPWLVAFSGGKDSTVLLHLATEAALEHGVPRLAVLYNDTLVELPPVREYSASTLDSWLRYARGSGLEAETIVTVPPLTETFYWRALVRGYTAPTFKYRWCTERFKVRPAKRVLRSITDGILLVGSRDDESPARAALNRGRALSSCPVGSCLESFLMRTDQGVPKVAPLRHWSEESVWEFLSKTSPPWGSPSYDRLVELYGGPMSRARFGCWMCTVSKQHYGFRALLEKHRELEPLWRLRLVYMLLSDIKPLRRQKTGGYSRLGGFSKQARGLLYALVHEHGRDRGLFYGLHHEYETPLGRLTLWRILYGMSPGETADAIHTLDPGSDITAQDIEQWRSGAETMLRQVEAIVEAGGDAVDKSLLARARSLLQP